MLESSSAKGIYTYVRYSFIYFLLILLTANPFLRSYSRITNDKTETKMDDNLDEISKSLHILKYAALDINKAVVPQNDQIDRMNQKVRLVQKHYIAPQPHLSAIIVSVL